MSGKKNWYRILKLNDSREKRKKLYHHLLMELEGDMSQTLELMNAYELLESKNDNNVTKNEMEDNINLLNELDIGLTGEKIIQLNTLCEKIIEEKIKSCYGRFTSWNDCIIDVESLTLMQNKTMELVPMQYNTILKLLGYTEKMKLKRYKLLSEKFFGRIAIFKLFQLARMRWKRRFVLLGIVGAGASFGKQAKQAILNTSILFGINSHFMTLMRFIAKYRNVSYFKKAVENSLKTEVFPTDEQQSNSLNKSYQINLVMYDNTQKNFGMKFVRGGSNSIFLKLT